MRTTGPVELRARWQHELRRLQALEEVGRALVSARDPDALLALVLEKAAALTEADRATLFLVEGDGQLRAHAVEGGAAGAIVLRPGQGLAGWVARTGASARVEDAYADPRFSPETDRRTGYRTRSVLSVPMPDSEGRVVGVLQALNKRAGGFSDDDEALLAAMAGQAGCAIENARLYRELADRVHDLDLLVKIERALSGAEQLDALLERLLQSALELTDAEAGAVLLREEDSAALYFRSAHGPRSEAVRRLRLAPGEGIAGWVAAHGVPARVEDPASDPRHAAALSERLGYRPRNLLCVPIAGPDGSLGALQVLDKLPAGTPFASSDEQVLTLLAGQLAKALERARAAAARAADERLAAIGQSLSGVLHDLRTPMALALGYAELMASSRSDKARHEQLALIGRQFARMEAFIRDVLAYARGETTLLVRKVYVGPFFSEVRDNLVRELSGRKVAVEVAVDYTGVAWFDELKLDRVITNLARNAAQAMPDGGRLEVRVAAEGDELALTVADTGPGIPPELQGRLFSRFSSGRADGTGLGLAIVKKIVDDHHGRITCRSGPDGTCFAIRLPLRPPEPR